MNQEVLLELVNSERVAAGSPELMLRPLLCQIAMSYATEMARRGSIDHQGEDGSWPKDRAERAGYGRDVTENNAGGEFTDPADIVWAWMQSADHREAMLDPKWSEVGFGWAGSADGKLYWCAEFGIPKGV